MIGPSPIARDHNNPRDPSWTPWEEGEAEEEEGEDEEEEGSDKEEEEGEAEESDEEEGEEEEDGEWLCVSVSGVV